MENRDILPRKKMESITYGAQCLVKQTMPCAECPIHAEGHEYPRCLHELGKMILDADAGEVGGMTGLIIREKNTRIENMDKIIEDQQERIDIMAADMQEWHFVNFRPLTDEEKAHYKDEYDETPETMIENLPDDGEEVILWDGIYVQTDTYLEDDVYFDKAGEIRPGMAWMPLPKPPKGDDPNAHSSD